MILTDNYIMSVEFAKKTGMNMTNVSMAKKELEKNGNYTCIRKIGQGTFIDKRSSALPDYIQKGISEHQFTNMKNKMPLVFFSNDLGIIKTDLYSLRDTNPEIITKISFIEGVEFIEFNSNFVKILESAIAYVLTEPDFMECHKLDLLDGHVKLSSGKYMIWYYA